MRQFSTAFLYFIAFFGYCNLSFGQGESVFKPIEQIKSIDQLLSENVRYPTKALQDRKEGSVLLSLKINMAGFIDSLFIIESTNEIFKNEALIAVGFLESKWSPELLKEKSIDHKYFLFFKFDAFLNEALPNQQVKQAEKLIEKGNFKNALRLLDDLLIEHPYQSNTNELR
jgi:TonB family protein